MDVIYLGMFSDVLDEAVQLAGSSRLYGQVVNAPMNTDDDYSAVCSVLKGSRTESFPGGWLVVRPPNSKPGPAKGAE
jgi:hypothetical protein